VQPRQVGYLRSYLHQHQFGAGATIVVERPYVDRHYLEEYTAYYARKLSPPSTHTSRLHVFRSEFTLADFLDMLKKSANGEQTIVESDLNDQYLGYVTVRPIPSAPIGRTVLAHYGVKPDRCYDPASTRHVAHLCGLTLQVTSLPFQQQDRAVGACATTATWAALSRAARGAGRRAPTPFAVTSAATRHQVNDRDLPADGGLEIGQLTTAIRELGFSPYTLKASEQSFAAFAFTLKIYLRSGVPAVLYLSDNHGEYHAVTVAGYKCSADELLELPGPKEDDPVLKTSALTRLYVHDDRVGPYVKMCVNPPDTGKGRPMLTRVPVDQDADSKDDLSPGTTINYAVFPFYPKLRLSALDLIEEVVALLPLFRLLVGPERREALRAECWFALNGDYLREAFQLGVQPPDRLAELAKRAVLSRYVGVIRWYIGQDALADIICDTTDISREDPPHGIIIAAVLFPSNLVNECRKYLSHLPDIIVV